MSEDIKKILTLAIHAPSGENCQPWKFQIHNNKIIIQNLPERDASHYSWGQRSSYLAHGALIENIIIASKEFGYQTTITLFPDSDQTNLVAEISFQTSLTEKDQLFPYIVARCTNRKPYKTIPLTEQQKQALLSAADSIQTDNIALIENREKINKLSKLSCYSEKIIFENKSLHNFFFKHINWTKQEDNQKSIGFYLDTLELSPPAKSAFKLVKNWRYLNLLNKIGFSKIVAKDNYKIHASATAHGVIYIDDLSKENFILAGRIMQRVWLTATKLGLSLQPMTGILYLFLKIKAGEFSDFTPKQTKLIQSAYAEISNIFEARQRIIPMYFRIGFSEAPSARSTRLPLTNSVS